MATTMLATTARKTGGGGLRAWRTRMSTHDRGRGSGRVEPAVVGHRLVPGSSARSVSSGRRGRVSGEWPAIVADARRRSGPARPRAATRRRRPAAGPRRSSTSMTAWTPAAQLGGRLVRGPAGDPERHVVAKPAADRRHRPRRPRSRPGRPRSRAASALGALEGPRQADVHQQPADASRERQQRCPRQRIEQRRGARAIGSASLTHAAVTPSGPSSQRWPSTSTMSAPVPGASTGTAPADHAACPAPAVPPPRALVRPAGRSRARAPSTGVHVRRHDQRDIRVDDRSGAGPADIDRRATRRGHGAHARPAARRAPRPRPRCAPGRGGRRARPWPPRARRSAPAPGAPGRGVAASTAAIDRACLLGALGEVLGTVRATAADAQLPVVDLRSARSVSAGNGPATVASRRMPDPVDGSSSRIAASLASSGRKGSTRRIIPPSTGPGSAGRGQHVVSATGLEARLDGRDRRQPVDLGGGLVVPDAHDAREAHREPRRVARPSAG